MLQFVIKNYGTAELLLIKSASVSLSRVKFIRYYADMAELADAYGSACAMIVKKYRSHEYERPFLFFIDYLNIRLCEKISVNSKTVIKTLLSERLYSAAQIFLQYTMDTVICQGSLDINLLEWSAAEWNQADIRRLSRSCRDT